MRLLTYFISYSSAEDKSIYIDANTKIQVIETMLQLPQADKEQCGAFVVRKIISCLPSSFSK